MITDYRNLDRFPDIEPEELEQLLRTFDRGEDHYDPIGQGIFACQHFECLVANVDRLQRRLAAERDA